MSRFWEKWKNWELWPFWMRYFLITPVWLLYCLRARSFWFFTPSNPTLTFGGFEGEPKSEMYDQLPPGSFPKTIFIQPDQPFDDVVGKMEREGFAYPFIVKPDVGMSGILFRKIENEEQLRHYHHHMPVVYLIQTLIEFPIEFSVFYYRFPKQDRGVITGFLQKEPLHVYGNGKLTLADLIDQHPKAKHRREELITWHKKRLHLIIPEGEKFYLTLAANLNRGGNFVNLQHEIDDALHQVFDEISKYSKHFFYGRYDLKAASLADLKQGENYQFLEYNGAGAEPNHVYNSGYSLNEAHREILKHWKVLFQISRINHKSGISHWTFWKGWNHMQQSKRHFEMLHKIDNLV